MQMIVTAEQRPLINTGETNGFFEHYFSVRYGDMVVLLYYDDMRAVVDSLNNRNKHKTLRVFLEYCYMINVYGACPQCLFSTCPQCVEEFVRDDEQKSNARKDIVEP